MTVGKKSSLRKLPSPDMLPPSTISLLNFPYLIWLKHKTGFYLEKYTHVTDKSLSLRLLLSMFMILKYAQLWKYKTWANIKRSLCLFLTWESIFVILACYVYEKCPGIQTCLCVSPFFMIYCDRDLPSTIIMVSIRILTQDTIIFSKYPTFRL